MRKIQLLILGLSILLASCSIEPQPIHYGKDQCAFCKMNIVDKMHASQYVTKKGKSFKFDAIECMINDLKTTDHNKIALFLIADYANPGVLTNALEATYLISENIKSPMGANLSGFASNEKAKVVQGKNEGTIFDWNQLQIKFQDR